MALVFYFGQSSKQNSDFMNNRIISRAQVPLLYSSSGLAYNFSFTSFLASTSNFALFFTKVFTEKLFQ